MEKLHESIPSTNVKIIELYNKIDSGTLKLDPDFQRKLVWKKQHKYHFIETILKNFPFPEVYIASSEMDVSKITSSEIVVDGQQRLSTIVNYIKGVEDFDSQQKVKSFDDLEIDEKKSFLNYLISVRDLKNLDIEFVKEIFMRINNTEYSLNAIEKVNAQYGDGEFVVFCKQIVESDFIPSNEDTEAILSAENRVTINDFLSKYKVFSENDLIRMISLQYMMALVATIIESEYFPRNVKVIHYMEKYNNSFDRRNDIENLITDVFITIDNLALSPDSYWFNKANFFSLCVELSKTDRTKVRVDDLSASLNYLDSENKKYLASIELDSIDSTYKKYFDFAKEGVNAKAARDYRGDILRKLIATTSS